MKNILLGLAMAGMLINCGGTNSALPGVGSSSSGGTNTTTLDASNLNSIVLTTTANNVGASATYYHVSQSMENASLNEVFNQGTNYTGTLTTTCVRGTATTTSVSYTCTSVYNTSAPFATPDVVRTVNFNIGDTIQVYQNEPSLQAGTKKTSIGSFVVQ
jgi:hypothetical protein